MDATPTVGDDGLWNAGSKMGKSGLVRSQAIKKIYDRAFFPEIACLCLQVASDWHRHPITFERSIRVTQAVKCLNATRCAGAAVPADNYPPLGCAAGTVIVQGHEQSKPLTLRSGSYIQGDHSHFTATTLILGRPLSDRLLV